MEITVLRFLSAANDSLGHLYVDYEWMGVTLEDEQRLVKIPQETRIPAGRYPVELRKAGSLHDRYKERFDFHQGMLHIRHIPDFTWVYFHCGLRESHTAGCILVADGFSRSCLAGYAELSNSVEAYTRFYKKVLPAVLTDEVFATIEDEIAIEGLLKRRIA